MATLSSRLTPLTVSVPAASEWVSFTPVWSGWTTNVTHTGQWRRVGDSIEMLMHATFTGANTQGSIGSLTLPNSLTIDTAKFPTTTNSEKNYVVGNWEGMDTGVLNTASGTVFYRQDLNAFFLAYATGDLTATNVSTTANRPFTISNGDTFSIRVTLPITGWTSHTASATSANALVIGGQSVGSTLTFGATSNQGFSILANNTAVLSSTAAGALSAIGPLALSNGPASAAITTRFNGSNAPAVMNYFCSNGNPYFGINTVQTASSDNQTYAVTNRAARMVLGTAGGIPWQLDVAPSGTAGNTISWTTAISAADTGAVTLGPSTGSALSHIVQSGNATTLLVTSASSADSTLILRRTGATSVILRNSAGNLNFLTEVSSVETTVGTVVGGVWTLGSTTGTNVEQLIGTGSTGGSNFRPTRDNVMNCGTASFRWGTVFAAVGTINTSDERLKKNIQPLTNILAKVNQLQPKTWESKYESYFVGTSGFIAQELEAIFPELVQTQSDEVEGHTAIKTVAVSGPEMAAILVKAIQELNAKIEALETQIAQNT